LDLGDVPTWLLVLVSLLALGAAALAYEKQSQEVHGHAEQLRLESEQLADQKRVNNEQIRLMALQEQELRAAQEERERQDIERREAQAHLVAAWFGSDSDPEDTGSLQLQWGAFVRNASLLPVFDVRVFFHFVQELSSGRLGARGLSWYPIDRGGPIEPIRVLPPGERKFVEIPEGDEMSRLFETVRAVRIGLDPERGKSPAHLTEGSDVSTWGDLYFHPPVALRHEVLDLSSEGSRLIPGIGESYDSSGFDPGSCSSDQPREGPAGRPEPGVEHCHLEASLGHGVAPYGSK